MDSRNNHKRNYNLMNHLCQNISNAQNINAKSLKVLKFKYYNFLEKILIYIAENKNLKLSNFETLYQNAESNSINTHITKLDNFKVNMPKSYFNVMKSLKIET